MGSEFWIQLCSEVLLLSFLMSVSYKIWWELPVFSALAVAAWLPVIVLNQSAWAQFSRSSASTAEDVYYYAGKQTTMLLSSMFIFNFGMCFLTV